MRGPEGNYGSESQRACVDVGHYQYSIPTAVTLYQYVEFCEFAAGEF